MDTSDYLDGVRANVDRFVAAVRRAGLDSAVPTCPDWRVSDLVLHQGQVFRWMAELVRSRAQEFVPKTAEPAEGEDRVAWLQEGADEALRLFRDTDPDVPVWNWLDRGPGPARFWYRRMAHEAVIHRADAEAAAGLASRVEPAELASDGIDEFLHFLPVRQKPEVVEKLAGSFHFHTTDVEGEWVVLFGPDGVNVTREHAKADVAIRGPASELELFLYNRRGPDGLETFGDPAKIATWTELIRF